MAGLNQYAISQALGSQIADSLPIGHGMLGALATQNAFLTATAQQPNHVTATHDAKMLIVKAFKTVRDRFDDQRSPDFYVAEQDRNAAFLAECRSLGLTLPPAILNHLLMNARKTNLLTGLNSKSYTVDSDVKRAVAFACEFVASRMRYEYGCSVDGLICDPELSLKFHSRVQAVARGYKWIDYRWSLLSIRKSGSTGGKDLPTELPTLSATESLDGMNSTKKIPAEKGIFALTEGETFLYLSHTDKLDRSFEIQRNESALSIFRSIYWQPNDPFQFRYVALPKTKGLKNIEVAMVLKLHPLFNVPRSHVA